MAFLLQHYLYNTIKICDTSSMGSVGSGGMPLADCLTRRDVALGGIVMMAMEPQERLLHVAPKPRQIFRGLCHSR
jgi:hypothetical protein